MTFGSGLSKRLKVAVSLFVPAFALSFYTIFTNSESAELFSAILMGSGITLLLEEYFITREKGQNTNQKEVKA
ncbi:MAG: hypothetical protein M1386_05775 [Candidatus Thermoplasmatota archaeon]|nr:hypothetical protein [Candidatus Thermoplasmatota archaeon]